MAGDICAVGRLSRAETGDTLSDKANPLVLKPWTMPEPLLPVAVAPHAKTDEDKLAVGLARLVAEDPTLRVEQNRQTHQIVLWCMGEAHAGVLLDALAKRYGVAVDTVELRVPLRETFSRAAKGHGRHVKQSGGHGQYAVCDIEVEPLPEGTGFEFVDKVVGGAVPRQFIPSVEKGVRAQMEKGVSNDAGSGHPLVDIRVTLVDGKAHSVDSSDYAFQMAGALALREAAAAVPVNLLEPVDFVSVMVPDDLVGAVMSDLSSRRGRVLGTDRGDDDRTVVNAELPQVELARYAIDLRALSHGAGSFTRSFVRYDPMPESAAAKREDGSLMALRIVQWGTGAVGRAVLTAVLDPRSGLELAGVKVYSDDKDGVDAGVLIGRDPVGVTASRRHDGDPRARRGLCGLHAAADRCRRGLRDPGQRQERRHDGVPVPPEPHRRGGSRPAAGNACEQGGTTVHGCGLNPGNLSGALPLALSGMSRTIEKLTLQERADWSVYDSTAITFDNMRFGAPVDEIRRHCK